MITKILNYIKYHLSRDYKISYSQNGEDILISRIFKNLNIQKVYYLDIGANHPKKYSNTYLLYSMGSSGVCVEPNKELSEKIKKNRPRDNVLNVAISDKIEILPYFSFKDDALNTFSEEESRRNVSHGNKFLRTYPVRAVTLNNVFDKLPRTPDLVSLDIEWYDEKALRVFDFSKYKPIVWCIETIKKNDEEWSKNTSLIKLVEENGYVVYGDTNINTIFVKNEVMKKINKINTKLS